METSRVIRSIVKIAALAIIVIFFIPTFCVSCGDYAEVEFSAFDAAVDKIDNKLYEEMETTPTDDDEDEIKAAPILFLIVIMAFVIFMYNNMRPLTSMLCAAGCSVMMLLMKQRVEKFISGPEYAMLGIDLRTTSAYTIHTVLCIGIIIALLFERYLLANPERTEQIKGVTGKAWQEIKNLDRPAGANSPSAEKSSPVKMNSMRLNNEGKNLSDEKVEKPSELQFWECSCGSRNNSTSTYCSVCYKGRPENK